MSFIQRYGARVAARWEAIACSEHDRVVDLRPVATWWPFMLDLPKVLRHLRRCPCYRHEAERCLKECAAHGRDCLRGPLTQLEVGQLVEAVNEHQPVLVEAGSRAGLVELTRQLKADGVPLDQLVDIVYLLAANGFEDPQE